MIFLGDLACPPEKVSAFNESIGGLSVLSGQTVIVNLEAVIPSDLKIKSTTLYNDNSVLDGLQAKAKRVIVSLANNHMYDYPGAIISTKNYLESKGIGVVGLQDSNGDIIPYEFEEDGFKYALFGHCWNLYTRTNPNRENKVRIVDCHYKDFVEVVREYIQYHPERRVYCFMHWNYDLEKYPFPMHVRFSRDLIDSGVEGVIGSHAHVPHGVELYKGKPIAYCLGNFYLPSGIYFDGSLSYPQESRSTLGLRINADSIDVLNFETDMATPVSFSNITQLTEETSFNIPDIDEYVRFFRKNRTKKFMVPVFNRYSGTSYNLKNMWAIQRVKLIKLILKLLHK